MQYLKTHLYWLVILAVLGLCARSWLIEHDNRLLAQQQEKVTATELKASADRERLLAQQLADVQAKAEADKQVWLKQLEKVKTPEQAKPVIETLAPTLHPEVVPNTDNVTVAAVPLATVLTRCQVDAIDLGACRQQLDLKDKVIAEKVGQIKTQGDEIKELKKPQRFWKRVTGHGKAAVVGILVFEGVKVWLSGKP